MRRRTELYWIGRGEGSPPTFRYPGHAPACTHAGDTHARYPAGWADDRPRFPGEIAVRDLAASEAEEQLLVLARFSACRWLHRLLTDAPVWELDAERQAAHDYADAALRQAHDPPAAGEGRDIREAAATIHALTDPNGPSDAGTLLATLRQASTQAAALDQPAGALAVARVGYLAALAAGHWQDARWFARELAEYLRRHGAGRLAGRWVRRARALEQRLRDSTADPS